MQHKLGPVLQEQGDAVSPAPTLSCVVIDQWLNADGNVPIGPLKSFRVVMSGSESGHHNAAKIRLFVRNRKYSAPQSLHCHGQAFTWVEISRWEIRLFHIETQALATCHIAIQAGLHPTNW